MIHRPATSPRISRENHRYPLGSRYTPLGARSMEQRLARHADRLFAPKIESDIGFLERDTWETNAPTISTRVTSLAQIQSLLTSSASRPQCRILTIGCLLDGELKTTQQMLSQCLEHFKIDPEFIDFVTCFGQVATLARDEYFSSFRHYSSPELSVGSSQQTQLCYSLKSMEEAEKKLFGWQFCNCAVSLTMDLSTGCADWLILKNGIDLTDHLQTVFSNGPAKSSSPTSNAENAFKASLNIHLMLLNWCANDWRWAILVLEDDLFYLNRKTSTSQLTLSAPKMTAKEMFIFNKSEKSQPNPEIPRRRGVIAQMAGWFRKTKSAECHNSQGFWTNPETGLTQSIPPDVEVNSRGELQQLREPHIVDEDYESIIEELNQVKHLIERARDTELYLKMNLRITGQLIHYYTNTTTSPAFPTMLAENCRDSLREFELHISEISAHLEAHISRTQSLLQRLHDRKDWLQTVLETQNTVISKVATLQMMFMTEDMNDIARKTKVETTSMKVITLVTLCFLPGTFISTLMSTDMFQSSPSSGGNGPNHTYDRLSPWQMFLVISLPLTFVTFLIWAAFNVWERQKAKEEAARLAAQRGGSEKSV